MDACVFLEIPDRRFASVPTEAVSGVFTSMLASPTEMGIFMALTVFGGFGVCGLGLHNGVERITKVMMLCLLVLIVVLAAHSVSLKGGGPGLAFYLLPDWTGQSKQASGTWQLLR